MKTKKCKGTGKAKGFGCNKDTVILKYGLCYNCYKDFLFNSDVGKEILKKTIIRAEKKIKTDYKKKLISEKKAIKTNSEYKRDLQKIVNEIVRLIDIDENCISCGYDFRQGNRRAHASHYFSVGAYPGNRYNFNNIHNCCSICNVHKHGNLAEYRKGIIKRYGKSYLERLESQKHNNLNLSIQDVKQWLKNAKNIKKRILSGADFTRDELNEMIKDVL